LGCPEWSPERFDLRPFAVRCAHLHSNFFRAVRAGAPSSASRFSVGRLRDPIDPWRSPYGQTYPNPTGDLKQPTDSGNTCRGSHNTTSGRKIVNAMAAKKMT
jgi:hypothetical protein